MIGTVSNPATAQAARIYFKLRPFLRVANLVRDSEGGACFAQNISEFLDSGEVRERRTFWDPEGWKMLLWSPNRKDLQEPSFEEFVQAYANELAPTPSFRPVSADAYLRAKGIIQEQAA